MADPTNTTALYFHDDGFDPVAKELNGRRIAGASFLKGYLDHCGQSEIAALVDTPKQMKAFEAMARQMGFNGKVSGRLTPSSGLPSEAGVLHLPGPVLSKWAWRRQHQGGRPYSLCGVTHTTATSRIMNGLVDMRMAPVHEWDGVILTSNAVAKSLGTLLDEADMYLSDRFGVKQLPPRWQMPVIPLGLDVKAFAHNPSQRLAWRGRLGIPDNACLIMTMSRLNSFAKFDPIPMFKALEIAALGTEVPVHFIAVGPYSDKPTTRVFERGAAAFAPSVTYHHVDGTQTPDAHGIWSAADIFTHPVDNIQETFGLAPVEAMAAGLPVVVSDWDGFKDTIIPEAGFRIQTTGPKSGSFGKEGLRYYLESDTYAQYLSQMAFQTVIDVPALAQAYLALINDPEKRQTMGQAGLAHAKANFDWSKIIPRYQEFWGELDAIRNASFKDPKTTTLPIGADPSTVFASYPTELITFEGEAFEATHQEPARQSIEDFVKLRELKTLKRMSVRMESVVICFETIQRQKGITYEDLGRSNGMGDLDRALQYLLKYDFIRKISKIEKDA